MDAKKLLFILFAASCYAQDTSLWPSWVFDEPNTIIHAYSEENVHQIMNNLNAGEKLIIHEGTYSESSWYQLQVQGTALAPVFIEGAPGEEVIITRPDANQNNINIQNSEFLSIRNIKFRGGDTGIKIYNVNNLVIEDCEVYKTNGVGIAANSADTHHLYMMRNHIHHTGGHGEGYYLGCNNADCILRDSVVYNNLIYDTTLYNVNSNQQGDGIEVKHGSYGNLVKDNTIFNVNYPGIIVYGTNGQAQNIVEGNIIVGSGDNCIQAQGEAIVRNNVLTDCAGNGIKSQDHQGTSVNLQVLSNTVVGESVRFNNFGNRQNMVFANNVVYNPGGTAVTSDGQIATGGTVQGNVVLGSAPAIGGFIQGNALTDFEDSTAMNYYPANEEFAGKTQVAGYNIDTDLLGNNRGTTIYAGAFENLGAGFPLEKEFRHPARSAGNCPPMAPASGNTVIVSTATELTNAINSATADTTILLNDGTYNVRDLQLDTSGLTLRSVSGNRDSVILDGEYQGGSILNVRADHVTVADLTIKRSWYHPIHVGGGGHYAKIYNVKIIDGKEQFIKVNPNAGAHNDYGEVACSHLELTPAGRQYIHNNPTPGFQCYTGGLDLHQSWGWIVRDNTIKDIYCTNGGLAEHAVHFWQTNRDSIVERNTIINCARGIGFGLGSQGNDRIYLDDPLAGSGVNPATVDHIGGIIRNNFIFSDTTEYDTGIGLEAAWNVTVAHNTIYGKAGNSWNSAIDTRFVASNPLLVNNLYYPRTTIRNSGSPTEINNVLATAGMFVDMDNADLHLTQGASVIDQGTTGYAVVDNDGNHRDNQPDIGADEYGSHTPVCTPMTVTELNQIISAWKDGTQTIIQLMTAIEEWKEGCN